MHLLGMAWWCIVVRTRPSTSQFGDMQHTRSVAFTRGFMTMVFLIQECKHSKVWTARCIEKNDANSGAFNMVRKECIGRDCFVCTFHQ